MRMRRRHLPLAALLGAAVAVLPAIAASETTPSISAYNEPGVYGFHSWMPSTATVPSGGVVKFSNPYTTTYHGLKFTGGSAGATPSCIGIPTAASEEAGALHWEGECTFSQPGTYTFICTVHSTEMKGTITVNPNGTTTTSTTTTPTTPTTTPTTTGSIPTGSPLVGNPSLRSSQHGGSVKGSLDISSAGVGDRLEIDLFAKGASLARTKHPPRIRVGRLVRESVSAGRTSFVVQLNAAARRALKRHKRLALTVRITFTSVHRAPFVVTRSVVEHG
jgi:plastocyanin